ncbi:MAG: TonB-dependent receptor [Gammaproteobacteria bacterium]|nr:TonB-dependent receptor [Gammaproteobacteria bacterium]
MKLSKLSAAILVALSSTYTLASTELDQVVVTANHTPTSLHSVTASTTVITAEEITSNHYRTLDDAIRSIPGIQIIRNGGIGTKTSILMRGQSNSGILVLVNGVEMTNPMGTGGAIASALLIGEVERIEVLKGAQSGIWGANASAGVINIITKQAKKDTHGTINVETGSNNFKKLAGSLSSATDEGDFAVSFSNITTDGFSSVKNYQENASNFEDDAFNQTDVSLNVGINISKQHRVEVLLNTANSTANYDYTSDPDKVVSVDYKNTLKRLQYLFNQGDFNATAYISQNEIKQYNDAVINAFGVKGGYQYAENQTLAFVASSNQYLNYGTGDSYYNTGLGLTNTNIFNNGRLIITEALRSDSYNKFDDKTTGKLGIKNYFNDDLFIQANLGTAYNAPTLYQSTYNATANLNPEESQSFDIGFGAYGLEVSYYQTRTKNLIGFDYVNYAFYENLTGTSTFEGIEVAYQRYLKSINTNLSVNYTQGTAKDDNGQWLARRAENTANLALSYEGFDQLSLGLQTRYIGNKYDKADQLGANIGDYLVTDLNANYAVSNSLNVYISVLNAFEEDYTHAVGTYEADNLTPKTVYSNGGRQIFVGIQGTL